MAPHPLVSVITPTYNHASYIGDCIKSVLSQSYPHWELLIVNDGSTDATASIAAEYAGADSRVRVFDRENVGVFKLDETYNHALKHAKGEFVAILEGDDLWEPTKLSSQIAALEANPEAILCWSRAMIVNNSEGQIRTMDCDVAHIDHSWRVNTPVGMVLEGLYRSNFIPAASILIKTEDIREIGGFIQKEGLPLVDYPTLLALATRGQFAFVDAVLAKWRWHPDQVTRRYHTDIIERVRDVALEHYRDLSESFRNSLTVTEAEIKEEFDGEVHRAYVQSGRYKLINRQFAAARGDFVRALAYPGLRGPKLRLQALAGVGSSLIRTDLEWIARLAGKTDLSSRAKS